MRSTRSAGRTAVARVVAGASLLVALGAPTARAAGEPERRTEAEGPVADRRIRDTVEEQIRQDLWIELERGELEVSVDDGVVALRGEVNNLLGKDRATWLAEHTEGVRAVVNDMMVGEAEERSDRELRRVASAALSAEPALARADILVSVEDAVVALHGTAPSYEAAFFAEEAVRRLRGVREVDNRLVVAAGPAPADEEIYAVIRRRLLVDPRIDAGDVRVAVRGGEVRVVGRVGSVAERERVLDAARVAGVTEVFADDLEVLPLLGAAPRARALTDAELEEQLELELERQPGIAPGDVNVDVDEGRVALHGAVPTLRARRQAERAARETAGVAAVEEDLEVVPPAGLPDEAVEDAVEDRIYDDPYVDLESVDVDVEDGEARLIGTVTSPAERGRARALAEDTPGVVSIDDEIRVTGEGADLDPRLATALEQRLRFSPLLEEGDLEVRVGRRALYLDGEVPTEQARLEAGRIAEELSARPVINRLRVE